MKRLNPELHEKNRRHLNMKRILLAAAVAVLAALPAAQLAYAGPTPPDVPSTIAVPDGHKLYLVAHAVGVQIYACNAIGAGYRWDFVAPRAELYDGNGKLLTTHFGGPTWQARDGSKVVGQVEQRETVDATAIPWLRLSAASTAIGPDGDRLAGTTYIQRIATTGGLAPAPATCNEGTAGDTAEIPYTADYTFWKAGG
jgi:Protein of unknown function (DUF3455)